MSRPQRTAGVLAIAAFALSVLAIVAAWSDPVSVRERRHVSIRPVLVPARTDSDLVVQLPPEDAQPARRVAETPAPAREHEGGER